MAFPAGVTTAVVTAGAAINFHGVLASRIVVGVVPVDANGNLARIVHAATGTVLSATLEEFRTATDTVSFEVPHVDQDGFIWGDGTAATGWSYKVTVFAQWEKDSDRYTKTFQVLTGQNVVDLELVVDGEAGEPGSAPVPAVTSVNGYTGAVVVSGDTAELSTLPFSRAAFERRMRLSELRRRRGRKSVTAKTAVTIVMDHGLNKFDASVRPLLEARGLPVTLALNSGKWGDSTNNLVDGATVKSWHDAGWLEVANHGRSHAGYSTDDENTTEVVTGREELEATIAAPVDSWVQPSMATGDGFNTGDSPEVYWTTHTGRTVLRSHPVVTGLVPGDPLYPLDGEPVVGMKGGWIDTATSGVESAISSAISAGKGYIVRFHPQFLDESGYITTADLTAFLDKIVEWRDAGDIDVFQLRDFAIAEKKVPDSVGVDSGWRTMPDFTGVRADPARPGTWRLRRQDNRVTLEMVAVGIAGDGPGFLGPNAIPAGFTMAPNVAAVYEMASQHSSGVVSTVGWTHKVMVSDNDVTWRGIFSDNGSRVTTTPTNYASLIHGWASWTTNDPVPATWPGTGD